jgi:hypothetical protein
MKLCPQAVALHHIGGPFHFGDTLRSIVNRFSLERVLVFAGASAPLYYPDIWHFYERLLTNRTNVVLENNPGSADVIGFHPGAAVNEIDPPEIDNHLGRRLREVGLKRILIPNTSELHFDIDVPTDVAVLRQIGSERVGPRTREVLSQPIFENKSLDRFVERLRSEENRPTLCMAGRIETSTLQFYRANFPMRMHCLMEGRGLRYLVDQGETVVTPTSTIVREKGFEGLFRVLTAGIEFLVLDWRPMMVGLNQHFAQEERFRADLLHVDHVKSPLLQQFAAAAVAQDKEIILGGHSLVSGGLWQLGREILKQEGKQEWRPFPGRIT